MGLSWFMEKEEAKQALSSLTYVGEYESNGTMVLEYDGAMLFDLEMNVTLCFTQEGLIGLNYHDTKRNQSFLKWLQQTEDRYGIPNENARESASWFENPIGVDTAVYVFHQEEGVQISFYRTADTPEQYHWRKTTR